MPPVFSGSMTGVVNEDDPVGTVVLTVKASDGDTGNARRIVYSLASNPNGYFVIDPDTGVIRVCYGLFKYIFLKFLLGYEINCYIKISQQKN
jgi:hypothetical protein